MDYDELTAEIQQMDTRIEALQIRRQKLYIARAHLASGVSAGDYVVCEEKNVEPATFTRTYRRFEGIVTDQLDISGHPTVRILRRGTTPINIFHSITKGTRVTNKGPWKGEHND